MKTAFVITAAITAMVFTAAAQQKPPALQVQESERLRTARVAQMKTDERIAYYEKLVKDHPGEVKDEAGLAAAFIQKMRETSNFAFLDRATAVVNQILKADAKNYDGLRLLAEIETHRHNFPHAAELTAELAGRNPSDTGAWGLLGDSYMELGRYDDAAKAYEQMLTLAPNLTSYNRIAYQKFVTGHGNEALGWMQQAVLAGSLTPENLAWCEVEFGDMLLKTGHTQDAKTMYDRALETVSGYQKALGGLGRYYAATGEPARAIENFKKAQAIIPLPEYAAGLESAYRKLGRTTEADEQRQLLDIIDKLGQANGEKGNRALALAYADDKIRADRAVELARGEMPMRHDVYAYDALSWALYRGGQLKEAEEASAKAMEMKTPEPMFWYHAGTIAVAAGREAEGRELIARALSMMPGLGGGVKDGERPTLRVGLAGRSPAPQGMVSQGSRATTTPGVASQGSRATTTPGVVSQGSQATTTTGVVNQGSQATITPGVASHGASATNSEKVIH